MDTRMRSRNLASYLTRFQLRKLPFQMINFLTDHDSIIPAEIYEHLYNQKKSQKNWKTWIVHEQSLRHSVPKILATQRRRSMMFVLDFCRAFTKTIAINSH